MPTTISVAITLPINPQGVAKPLTVPQIWKGLVLKCKKPQEFIAAISSCRVVSETPTEIKRVVTFSEGFGPPGDQEEIITLIEGYKATFVMPATNTVITNLVSYGGSGRDDDLHMTFTFEYDHADIESGSREEAAHLKQYRERGIGAVKSTVDGLHTLAEQGKI